MSEIIGDDGTDRADPTAAVDPAELAVTPEVFETPGGGVLPADPADPDGAAAALRYTRGGTPC